MSPGAVVLFGREASGALIRNLARLAPYQPPLLAAAAARLGVGYGPWSR